MPKRPDKRQDKSQGKVKEDDKSAEYKGLPGVDTIFPEVTLTVGLPTAHARSMHFFV